MAIVDNTAVIEFNKVNMNVLHLNPLDADPDNLKEGDIWYRGDLHTLKIRINGVSETIEMQ